MFFQFNLIFKCFQYLCNQNTFYTIPHLPPITSEPWDPRSYNCSLTNSPAIPCPVPIHILVNNTFFFCLRHSLNPVTICLAPVAPKGCPKAIAPPLGFIFSYGSFKTSLQ